MRQDDGSLVGEPSLHLLNSFSSQEKVFARGVFTEVPSVPGQLPGNASSWSSDRSVSIHRGDHRDFHGILGTRFVEGPPPLRRASPNLKSSSAVCGPDSILDCNARLGPLGS